MGENVSDQAPSQLRKCPICAELIQQEALVCRHCGARAVTTPTGAGWATPGSGGGGTNGLAIASLVLGIIWIYWVGSILAVIFGFVAKKQIERSGGTQGGSGMATAGIVLGFVGLATLILVIVFAVIAAISASTAGDISAFVG